MRFTSASLKLTAGVAILATTASLAFAGHCRKPCDYKCEVPCPNQILLDGFYVGVGAGYNILLASPSANGTPFGVALSSNVDLAARGWDAGGFIGWGHYFDTWYLGAEAFGYWDSADASATAAGPLGSIRFHTRTNGDWGLAVIGGIGLNCTTLGYVKIGYDWASVRSSVNIHLNEPPTNFGRGRDSTRSGVLYGAGIETLVWENWSVRGEFDYINYTNNNTNGFGSRVHPNDNRVSLAIVYHFC